MARTLVLHSTEGHTIASAVATMDANRSWSNWVCDPRTGVLETLVDGEREDRSLKNLPGGVQTNNRPGVWQLEIVGFAEQIPGYGDDWYRSLARMVIDLCDAKRIPKVFPRRFVPYPQSYGFKAAQRMSFAEWLACDGIVGHQHVPENDHGDPGDLNRLIPLVTGAPMLDLPPDRAETIRQIQQVLVDAGFDLGTFGPNKDGVDGDPGPPDPARSRTLDTVHRLRNDWAARGALIEDLKADAQGDEGRIHELMQRIAELEAGNVPPDDVPLTVIGRQAVDLWQRIKAESEAT